ncbi:MAG: CHAT domain-containing protein [Candidatus Eiseniibacteriota bacterium]
MSLVEALLAAPDRESLGRLVAASAATDLARAVEPMAAEVLRLLRIDARRAFEVAERADIVARSTPDLEARARAEWIRGHGLVTVSRLREGLDSYRSAARSYEKMGKRDEVARIAISQVNALSWLGRYREALGLGESARRTLRRTGQAAAAARLDLNLGNVHHWSGRPRRALACYDRALRFARRDGDSSMARSIQMNRATQLSALGRLKESESLFREVRDEADAAGEGRHRAVAEYNLGYILFQRGDYGSAYDALDSARAAFEGLGDDMYLSGTLLDLAELLIEVNDFRRASRVAGEARELAESRGLYFERGRAALLEGIAALAQGGVGEARSRLAQARDAFREEGLRASEALADVYLAEVDARDGDRAGACARLESAVAVFRGEGMRLHEAGAELARAAAELERGRSGPAQTALDGAGRALRRTASPWLRARLAHLCGRLAESRGRHALALRYYRGAVARIESIRGRIGIDEFRVSFSEDKAPVYSDLVEALLRRGGKRSVAEAFAVVERARSRALVDLLAGRLRPAARARDPETKRLLERAETLRAEINRLSGHGDGAAGKRTSHRRAIAGGAKLREHEARLTETLRRLERRDARLGALAVGETMTLAEAREGLPRDVTLVEYYLGSRGVRAFMVRRDEARVVELPASAGEVERRMAHLRFQIEKMAYGEGYASSRAAVLREGLARHLDFLSRSLWDPLAVPEGRTVIVPHGALHGLPFAALPVAGGGHVLDRHVLSYLPSASCRRYLREAKGRHGRSLLAVEVGDRAIPEVHREVREVRRAFPRGRRLGPEQATRERFRRAARGADVIHVATHGVFRGDDPGFSALRLSDGWMSLHDVYSLELDATLVTLSACQTGRHLVAPGDELVGLSRGFLYAGAGALLVSLWAVPDGSTADLMIAFYRALRAGRSPDECLREAMLSSRAAAPHPYHWAPFVLVGTG